jgi:phage tail sheath protein FI
LEAVVALDRVLTDAESGPLNARGINCLRSFPTSGFVAWGGRTLAGDDQSASDFKYIPVRRTALFIEESVARGTKWALFEPNDEPLWARLRLCIGEFLDGLFRQGAFQGATPREAYFVKCGRDTTTPADIGSGIVHVEVGFAPLRAAEFVVLRVQQSTARSEP